MVWIDYWKSFDSILHTWILETFAMSKVAPTDIKFMKHVNKWTTILKLQRKDRIIETKAISLEEKYSKEIRSFHPFSVRH